MFRGDWSLLKRCGVRHSAVRGQYRCAPAMLMPVFDVVSPLRVA